MPDPLSIARIGAEPAQLEAPQLRSAKTLATPPTTSFKDMLTEAIGEVQRLQTEADTTVRQLVAGEITDVTETMVAVEKADVAFQTMMVVRNKMVQAYEEIMRMQV
jgi:flagellar hook-basal body complex protein FliE